MKNQKRIKIIVLIILIAAVLLLGWLLLKGGDSTQEQAVAQGDPISVVLDFYEPWMAALRTANTDPYQSGLAENPILSNALRARLAEAEGDTEGDLDPVLCQPASAAEDSISARPIFENEDQAQVLVLSTQRSQNQAAVTLIRHNDGWYIDDIECTSGETAPEREFSFEQEGYLLKDSVPEPLDSQYWHLVFEQGGQQGHTAPLFFNAQSMCESADGEASTCNPDEFTEVSRAVVKGEMTETGVEVKRLEMME